MPKDQPTDATARERAIPFNINEMVWVRLTDHGRAILQAGIKRQRALHPGVNFKMPAEDADGWSRWQLWTLMAQLGPHIEMTKVQNPIETEMRFAVPAIADALDAVEQLAHDGMAAIAKVRPV